MTPPRSRLGTLGQVLLTVGAVLGVLSVLAAVSFSVFQVTPLVFRSGSMSPAIETGSLGLARPMAVADIRPGDIVSVEDARGTRVTHRVVTTDVAGNTATLVLQGDANDDPDPAAYVVTSADRVIVSVPAAGYVVEWLQGPAGVFALGVAVGVLALVIVAPRRRAGPGGRRRRSEAAKAVGTGAVVLAVAVPGLLLPVRPTSTLAAWSDSVSATGASATAYVVPAPVIASCANTPAGNNALRHVTLTWPAVTSPLLTYTVAVDVDPAATTTITGVNPKQVDLAYNPASATYRNKRITLSVTAAPGGASSWRSSADTWQIQTPNTTGRPTCAEKTAPTVGFTAPTTATSTFAAKATAVTSACGNTNRAACGTMTDGSTITAVQYLFQRTIASTTTCWTGTAWGAAPCTYRAGTIATQTVWRVPGNNNATTTYVAAGSYSLTVRVTDTWGNVTTSGPQVFTLT